jgi:hypothetical protein
MAFLAGITGLLSRLLPFLVIAPFFVGGLFGGALAVPPIAQTIAVILQLIPVVILMPVLTSLIESIKEITSKR